MKMVREVTYSVFTFCYGGICGDDIIKDESTLMNNHNIFMNCYFWKEKD